MARKATAKTAATKTKAVTLTLSDQIIRTESDLNREIGSFATLYSKTHAAAHKLMVSTLVHAAEHGQPAPLNRFFQILATNDKDAARLYIRRTFAILGGWDGTTTVPQADMETYKVNGAFLEYRTKEGFVVLSSKDHPTAKTARAKLMTFANQMIEPDGKVFKKFLERNNFAETKKFGPDELQRGLNTLLKKSKGDRKNIEPDHISDDMIAALEAAQRVIGVPASATQQ